MKNHLSAPRYCMTGLLCTMIMVGLTAAQTAKRNPVWAGTKSSNAELPPEELKPLVNGNSGNLNSISVRAMRDFKSKYPAIAGEQWSTYKDGTIATFTSEDIKYRVIYNQRGDWLYTLRYYDEKKLPFDIRDIVKRKYYDCLITLVDEILYEDKTIYIVHMQDDSTWKKVSVYDGEMKLLESYNKN